LQKYNEEIKKTAVWADLMSFFWCLRRVYRQTARHFIATSKQRSTNESRIERAAVFYLFFDFSPPVLLS